MLKRLLVFFLSVIAGYVTMVAALVLVLEVMLGGVSYHNTPVPKLLLAGVLTAGCAVAGGAVAARVFQRPWLPPAIGMAVLATIETTYLIRAGRLPGPMWFDMVALALQISGILVGACLVMLRMKQTESRPATP